MKRASIYYSLIMCIKHSAKHIIFVISSNPQNNPKQDTVSTFIPILHIGLND